MLPAGYAAASGVAARAVWSLGGGSPPQAAVGQPVPADDGLDIDPLEAVERNRIDRREREGQGLRIRGGDVLRHGLAHGALQADAAALAADVDQHAGRGLVQVREMV